MKLKCWHCETVNEVDNEKLPQPIRDLLKKGGKRVERPVTGDFRCLACGRKNHFEFFGTNDAGEPIIDIR
jgi:hypothetical protein